MSNKLMYRLGLEELVEAPVEEPTLPVDTDGSDSAEAHLIEAEESAVQADAAVDDSETLVEDSETLEGVVEAMESALASGKVTADTIRFSRTPVAGVYRRWGMDLPPTVSAEGMSDYALTQNLTDSMEGVKENLAKFYTGMVARIKQARDHIIAFIGPAKKAVVKIRERAHALKAHVEAAGTFAGGEEIKFSSPYLVAGGQVASGSTLLAKLKELETFTIHVVGPDGSGCLKTVDQTFTKLADDVVALKDAEKYNEMLNRTGEQITKAIGDYITGGLPKIQKEENAEDVTTTFYSNALLGGKSIEVTNVNYKSLWAKIGTDTGKRLMSVVGNTLYGAALGALKGAALGAVIGAPVGGAAIGGVLGGSLAGVLHGTAGAIGQAHRAFVGFPATYLANHIRMRTRKAPAPKGGVFHGLSSKDALAALNHVVAILDAVEVFFREEGARETALAAAEEKIDHQVKALKTDTTWYRRRFLSSISMAMFTVYNKLDNYNVQICSTNLAVARAVIAYVVASTPAPAAAPVAAQA